MSTIHTNVKNPQLVQKRREQIVLAAINLFSQKGFHKTTLRNLAEQTGLSQASIYDYVGSKEDIFFLIHELAASSAMEAMKKSLEQVADPLEKLRRMIRAEFGTMDKLADAIMLIYQEGHILTKPLLKSLLKKETSPSGGHRVNTRRMCGKGNTSLIQCASSRQPDQIYG